MIVALQYSGYMISYVGMPKQRQDNILAVPANTFHSKQWTDGKTRVYRAISSISEKPVQLHLRGYISLQAGQMPDVMIEGQSRESTASHVAAIFRDWAKYLQGQVSNV